MMLWSEAWDLMVLPRLGAIEVVKIVELKLFWLLDIETVCLSRSLRYRWL